MNIPETLFDNSLRSEQIIWLASQFHNEQPCDALESLIDEEDYDTLITIYSEIGLSYDPSKEEDDGPTVEEFLQACQAASKFGFLVQMATPIPILFHKDDGYTTNGFGMYATEWFYTEAFDEAFVNRLLAWKEAYIARIKTQHEAKTK